MAKSKVKKGFFYYLMIFICLLLGLGCIFIAVLIFNPGKDVFGINVRFVNHTHATEYYKTTDTTSSINDADYDTVVFNSGYTNFNIKYDSNEIYTKVLFKPNVTALSKSDITKFSVKIQINDKKLLITVVEPELWLGFSKSASVTLVCPNGKTLESYGFNLTTDTGSINMGDSSSNNYKINSLNIKTNSGTVTIKNNLSVKTENIYIESSSSNINVDSNISGTLSIYNKKGRINIGALYGNLDINNSERLEANCSNVGGNITLKSIDGYLSVKRLGLTRFRYGLSLNKEYGYTDKVPSGQELFDHINGNFTTLDNIKNTNINIQNMVGDASITSESGYVSIDFLNGQSLIETKSGNVEIKNTKQKIDINTESGSITFSQNGYGVRSTAYSEKGKITANFAKLGPANLVSANSDININVATGEPFKLIYTTKYGITISWYTSPIEKTGSELISGASESTTIIITASAENGKISLKDGYGA